MKKQILTFGVVALFTIVSATIVSCGSDSNEHNEHMKHMEGDGHHNDNEQASYQCPMKCEGEKVYEKSGTCPECGMELKKIEK